MDRLEQSLSVHDWTSPLSSSKKNCILVRFSQRPCNEVIQSFGCDGNYYEEAIVELKHRFGRPTVIVGTMIQQLIQHLPPIPNRPDTYIKDSFFIKTILGVFEAHNFTADLYSTTNLKHATDKLPFPDAVKWQQFLVKEKIEQPNLSTLSDWIQPIAEAYEQLQVEQQNVEHPATHQVLFVQNSKTTTAMCRQSPRTFLSFEGLLASDFQMRKIQKDVSRRKTCQRKSARFLLELLEPKSPVERLYIKIHMQIQQLQPTTQHTSSPRENSA